MTPHLAILHALHTASEKLHAAHDTAKAARRDDIAEIVRRAQGFLNDALVAAVREGERVS